MSEKLYLGIDLGTSGARAVVIDDQSRQISSGRATIEGNHRSPVQWHRAMEVALDKALSSVERKKFTQWLSTAHRVVSCLSIMQADRWPMR